jgi:hypothetical protein
MMKTTLLHELPMIPRLTASQGEAEFLAYGYGGWNLLEVDSSAEEILICKPCTAAWIYTRSKHLLILCGEAAAIWQFNAAVLDQATHRLTVNELVIVRVRDCESHI